MVHLKKNEVVSMKKQYYTPEQLVEIETVLSTTKNATLQRKYHAILLSIQGHTNLAIGKMLNLHKETIGRYVNDYQTKGLDGLVLVKQTGRPTFMTVEQSQILYAVIRDKTPHELGFTGRYNWTAKLASAWLEREHGVKYAESSILQQLYQLGLSYSRPSYTLASADKEKQAKFIEQLMAEKKLLNQQIDHLLFQDESTIRDYQALMSTWFPVGQQKLIKTYGKHFSVKLTGSLNYENGAVYVQESVAVDATVFFLF